MTVTKQADLQSPWLLLVFSLARKGASLRVTVWRKLQRYGALPLGNSGYFLPNTEGNRERFEWLATAVRTEGGEASVLEVQSIDNCSFGQMKQRFSDARAGDYRELLKDLRNPKSANQPARITRLRQRFQDIVAIDFFGSPVREQVERALNAMQTSTTRSDTAEISKVSPAEYRNRVWVTRPRPGVDRVTSAWLIRKFIDPKAKFAFSPEDKKPPKAVPFDMYEGGFGHRGEDCTFETLVKVFHIRDKKVRAMAEAVHDADLFDEKFGRKEGFGIDEVMKGWAREGLSDQELLKRGMQLAEGLYKSLHLFPAGVKRLLAGARNQTRRMVAFMKLRTLILSLLLSCPVMLVAQGLDTAKIDDAMGRSGQKTGDVYRLGFPRTDLHVSVTGVEIKPGLALGSWAAFAGNDNEAMVMGDLVLLENELTPVMKKLRGAGFEITAVHNHVLNESPRVIYMHYMGHGKAVELAKSLRAALAESKTPLDKPAPPPPAAEPPAFVKTIEDTLGTKGRFAGGVLSFGIPRAAAITDHEMTLTTPQGVAEAINFQEAGAGKVATTGDFVLTAEEVNPVISALEEHDIAVTALHSHMLTEQPRLFFMHFWAVGSTESVAAGIKAALSHVAVK